MQSLRFKAGLATFFFMVGTIAHVAMTLVTALAISKVNSTLGLVFGVLWAGRIVSDKSFDWISKDLFAEMRKTRYDSKNTPTNERNDGTN
ncbi:MAG: hypothetical protein HC836_49750 [Richelia sp. RM2_1_2]|nr:hypothetical protein [Richelia sp. RM2_1_2]